MDTAPQISPFARRVYAALMKVPPGRVITYAALGRRIGCRSPRAIGQALRSNPFAPRVPCHRVIASDLGPGGAPDTAGPELARKLRLLAAAGRAFQKRTPRRRPPSDPLAHNHPAGFSRKLCLARKSRLLTAEPSFKDLRDVLVGHLLVTPGTTAIR